jgi:hypothetical protein
MNRECGLPMLNNRIKEPIDTEDICPLPTEKYMKPRSSILRLTRRNDLINYNSDYKNNDNAEIFSSDDSWN